MSIKLYSSSHLSDMQRMFAEYYEHNLFTDVVIWSGDGTMSIRAHRLILAAGSDHLREKLVEHQHGTMSEPKLIVPFIDAQDLLNLVHFLYYNQVVVSEARLEAVLSAAVFLGIKGFKWQELGLPVDDEANVGQKRSLPPEDVIKSNNELLVQNNSNTVMISGTALPNPIVNTSGQMHDQQKKPQTGANDFVYNFNPSNFLFDSEEDD